MEIITPATIGALDLLNAYKDIAELNLGYLGLAITILVLLAGAFAYFNVKPLQNSLDKQEGVINELRNEARGLLDKVKTYSEEALLNFKKIEDEKIKSISIEVFNKSRTETLSEIAKAVKTLTENINTVSENKDDRLKELILSEINNRVVTLEIKMNRGLTEYNIDLRKEISKINKEIEKAQGALKDLKRTVKELEIYKYTKEGQMGSVILSIELLREEIDDNGTKGWQLVPYLEQLKQSISDAKLDSDYISQIEEQLGRLDAEKKFNVIIKEIREYYSKNNKISS